jgi:hypothetical protein
MHTDTEQCNQTGIDFDLHVCLSWRTNLRLTLSAGPDHPAALRTLLGLSETHTGLTRVGDGCILLIRTTEKHRHPTAGKTLPVDGLIQ